MVTRVGWMSRKKLLERIDAERVADAIRRAEQRTSGEIRVSISRLFWGDVYKAATFAFDRLRMHETRERNGVLLFVVPARRRFAVIGDKGIHERAGQAFWERVTAVVGSRFREGDFTGGIVDAVESIGEELRAHFPYDSTTDRNELPDDVDFER
jgi:uncharacterized membrane protein